MSVLPVVPAGVILRRADREDAALMAGLIRASFQELMPMFGVTKANCPKFPAFCQPEWIIKGFDDGASFVLAVVGEAAVGCVGMTAAKDGACELVRLAVLPSHRHCGIGRMLVQHVLEQARALGLERVELALVASNTRLLRWYETQGFTATRTDHPAHLPFDVTYMARHVANEGASGSGSS